MDQQTESFASRRDRGNRARVEGGRNYSASWKVDLTTSRLRPRLDFIAFHFLAVITSRRPLY